jgi:hypothetical protein
MDSLLQKAIELSKLEAIGDENLSEYELEIIADLRMDAACVCSNLVCAINAIKDIKESLTSFESRDIKLGINLCMTIINGYLGE